MGFEIFTRNVVKTRTPSVSITTMGRMAFNKAASATFEKNATEHVLLMFDSATNRIAVRAIGKKDQRAYRLSSSGRGMGAGFSCVTFLHHIRYDWSKTRQFQLEWSESEDMFIFSVPREFLQGKPEGEQLKLPKIKRRDSAKQILSSRTTDREVKTLTQ